MGLQRVRHDRATKQQQRQMLSSLPLLTLLPCTPGVLTSSRILSLLLHCSAPSGHFGYLVTPPVGNHGDRTVTAIARAGSCCCLHGGWLSLRAAASVKHLSLLLGLWWLLVPLDAITSGCHTASVLRWSSVFSQLRDSELVLFAPRGLTAFQFFT